MVSERAVVRLDVADARYDRLPRNVLDVYRPASGCRGAPVLLQIHGGDWTGGHKRQQALDAELASFRGCEGEVFVLGRITQDLLAARPARVLVRVDMVFRVGHQAEHIAPLGKDAGDGLGGAGAVSPDVGAENLDG